MPSICSVKNCAISVMLFEYKTERFAEDAKKLIEKPLNANLSVTIESEAGSWYLAIVHCSCLSSKYSRAIRSATSYGRLPRNNPARETIRVKAIQSFVREFQ